MPIPKIIHQTFKTAQLPFITRWYISRFRKKNSSYLYAFYNDEQVDAFLKKEYGGDIYKAYQKLNIGAAKADLFRYAILYREGGIYLDIDSYINCNLDTLIRQDDNAILALERHHDYYAQWALIYAPGHPFLKRTLDLVVNNITLNKYPNSVHGMTGPGVYTQAVKESLQEDPDVSYRLVDRDYGKYFTVKYKLAKFFLYKKKADHWKQEQQRMPLLKPDAVSNA
jgi:inositol phosphorylceramide mannosyltransferase catalytic subunit